MSFQMELTQRLEHASGQDDTRMNTDGLIETTNLAQCLPHSIDNSHSDNLVISRNQFEHINSKLDQLAKRVHNLEHTLAADVRMILGLLQAQQGKEPTTGKSEVLEYINIIVDSSSRPRYVFQRSISEPEPISSKTQHSQVLHSKTFDFDKGQDPWSDTMLKDREEDEKAPIAKLESLDELDLLQESPQSSPRRPKK